MLGKCKLCKLKIYKEKSKLKYKNANNILPIELIEEIQKYVQGEYIYIPIKDKLENTAPTEYEIELQKRDRHIYTKALEGVSNKQLSAMYSLSESSIRRIIIYQRKRYEAMKDRIKDILGNWNIENMEIKQVYDTAWQVGEKYVLKVYDNIQMLERNIKISTILEDMCIPIGKIIPARDNSHNKEIHAGLNNLKNVWEDEIKIRHNVTFLSDEKYYYVLQEKLHGSNIVSVKEALAIAFDMGSIIARLHCAFKKCEAADEFWNNSLLSEIKGWIKDTLEDSGWKLIDENRFNTTVEHLEKVYDKLPVQLIHRDVHFGNFLFSEGRFSGYIDFDLSQRNIRIFDLCYFMLGLLSEEEALKITEEEWFKILEDVFDGYQSIIKLSKEEKDAVPYVMKSIELLFIAWFIMEEDTKCAMNAVRIFEFVDRNIDRIYYSIR